MDYQRVQPLPYDLTNAIVTLLFLMEHLLVTIAPWMDPAEVENT